MMTVRLASAHLFFAANVTSRRESITIARDCRVGIRTPVHSGQSSLAWESNPPWRTMHVIRRPRHQQLSALRGKVVDLGFDHAVRGVLLFNDPLQALRSEESLTRLFVHPVRYVLNHDDAGIRRPSSTTSAMTSRRRSERSSSNSTKAAPSRYATNCLGETGIGGSYGWLVGWCPLDP